VESPPATPEQLAAAAETIEAWLAGEAASNPSVAAVDRDGSERRWFVRVSGDDKDVWSAWLNLGQRTLRFETYLMPAPESNQAQFYEHLLRRNRRLVGLNLEIGEEDAVFLAGSVPVAAVSDAELDRILGSLYAAVELIFRPALRIGFPRFKG